MHYLASESFSTGASPSSGISAKESMSYCASGSASKIIPSMIKPRATNSPKTKYHSPNSLKVGAGRSSWNKGKNNLIHSSGKSENNLEIFKLDKLGSRQGTL